MSKLLGVLILAFASISVAKQNEFNRFFNSFERLSANFEQSTYSENNTLLASSTGNLQFQRPQQLAWRIQTPNEQLLLLNNNELWLVDTELEQASLQQLDNLEQTPLYWLINRTDNIEKIPAYSHSEQGMNWYNTNQANQLRFGFRNNLLSAMMLNNELGQKILLQFSQVKTNPNLEQDTFKLKLGPDFDVIR